MFSWWKNLSVAKKLYGVVGLMALLIATELFTLLFVMDILSSVRSFVGGEGLWSKAQKDAVYSLQRYAATSDRKYFEEYKYHLRIPLGDREARLELLKPKPDLNKVRDGFLKGEIDPQDIPGLIRLIQRFYWISYLERAFEVWTQADTMIDSIDIAALELDAIIQEGRKPENTERLNSALKRIEELNAKLTSLEIKFSYVLGEGSRWLENLLKLLLILAVFTVEATGLTLTFMFSRNLSRSIEELSHAASEVGKGNFSQRITVRSRDELGQLAEALNNMIGELEKNIGEKERAESANKVKSLFLANMSHEIRTPLGVILGLAELLRDKNITWEEHSKYIETIERTGNNLKRIINDILDISKVEAGYLEIDPIDFSLSELMRELQTMLSVRASRRNNRLVFVRRSEIPSAIHSDRLRLRQILVNLIDNALKFTQGGTVRVEYWATSKNLFFEVTDTGIGISSQDVRQLFKPFSQADGSITRKYEGTGLGLILSKRLAIALGGDVVLKRSQVGKGSTFLARVALKIPDKKEELPEPSEPLNMVDFVAFKGKRVLLVDDSPDNRLLVKAFLSRSALEVDVAQDGMEALTKASESAFDLILMDVQMPVMDGHTATKELRARGFDKPIIALTAHAMKEDRQRCLAAGCNDYLTKPIELPLLYQTLAKYLFRFEKKRAA